MRKRRMMIVLAVIVSLLTVAGCAGVKNTEQNPNKDKFYASIIGFVRVINDSNEAIGLKNGSEFLTCQKGFRLVKPGSTETYELKTSDDEGLVYTNLNIEFVDSGKNLQVAPISVKSGKVYEFRIKTSSDYPTLVIQEIIYK